MCCSFRLNQILTVVLFALCLAAIYFVSMRASSHRLISSSNNISGSDISSRRILIKNPASSSSRNNDNSNNNNAVDNNPYAGAEIADAVATIDDLRRAKTNRTRFGDLRPVRVGRFTNTNSSNNNNSKDDGDPNALMPCIFPAHLQTYRLHLNSRRPIYNVIPFNRMLRTHDIESGIFCYPAFEVRNVVFSLTFVLNPKGGRYQFRPGAIFVNALHVPTNRFVGIDANFNSYALRSIVINKLFQENYFRLMQRVLPIQRRLGMIIVTGGSSSESPSQQQGQYGSNATWSRWFRRYLRDDSRGRLESVFIDRAVRKFNLRRWTEEKRAQKQEEVVVDMKNNNNNINNNNGKATDGGSSHKQIYVLPVDTEFVFIMSSAQEYVGGMPAVSAAFFLSNWAHFWASGIQSLGAARVTVVVGDPTFSILGIDKLFYSLVRFMPVPVLFVNRSLHNAALYHRRILFAPRGDVDVPEPCVVRFLRSWLVPTVVYRIKAALEREDALVKAGKLSDEQRRRDRLARYEGAGVRARFASANTDRSSDYDNNTTDPADGGAGSFRSLFDIAAPVDTRSELPWWDPDAYDHLVRAPPKKLIILKTGKYANTPGRVLKVTDAFRERMTRRGFTFVDDVADIDMRLFLLNAGPADTLVVPWGGGATALSHVWAGGALPRPRLLNVVMIIAPSYRYELGQWHLNVLRGTLPRRWLQTRHKRTDRFEYWIGPPSKTDHHAEGGYGFAYAWLKLLMPGPTQELGDFPDSMFTISDAEKAADYGVCRQVQLNASARVRTKHEFDFENNS